MAVNQQPPLLLSYLLSFNSSQIWYYNFYTPPTSTYNICSYRNVLSGQNNAWLAWHLTCLCMQSLPSLLCCDVPFRSVAHAPQPSLSLLSNSRPSLPAVLWLYHLIVARSVHAAGFPCTPTASTKAPLFSILSILPQQSKTIAISLIWYVLSFFIWFFRLPSLERVHKIVS